MTDARTRVRVEIGDFDEKRTCLARVQHVNGETCERFSRDDAPSWLPASDAEVLAKYAVLMRDVPAESSWPSLTRLRLLEAAGDVDWLRA